MAALVVCTEAAISGTTAWGSEVFLRFFSMYVPKRVYMDREAGSRMMMMVMIGRRE